ncbi:MarR family winged helix-turn-helix transcriptional regulator [Aquihabitans sp. McL0605]|uniref:MarR family winged helix-turn-helix transcriptional regulator n=1 Tax=Aquihabitans sp. McL0605 TaxID=3415671 RepID=UPI003CF306D0
MATTRRPTPGFLVWRLSLKWQAAVDRTVAPHGLTHAQYSLLASLRSMTWSGATPTQRELADQTGLDEIFVSKLIRTLEANALVVRSPHPTDARARQLSLTEGGIEVIDRAVVDVHDLLEQLTAPLGGLDDPQTNALVDTLQLLLDVPAPTKEEAP